MMPSWTSPAQHQVADGPTSAPRTWTFTDRETGEQRTVTCMPGCESDHRLDMDTPTYPDDIWCITASNDVTLPINTDGEPEEFRVLSWTMNMRPFANVVAQRLPHLSLEVLDDHWVENLDPDSLATVINRLAERVDQMREAHTRLIEVRAEYQRSQA